jgi:two-component system response regulator HydG
LVLAQHFLSTFSVAMNKSVTGLHESAAEKLLLYPWPGNVRELRNVMERAVALTVGDRILVDDLPERVRQHRARKLVLDADDPSGLLSLEQVEQQYILHVLESTGGNRTQTARILGLDRKTLYRKLKQFGVE